MEPVAPRRATRLIWLSVRTARGSSRVAESKKNDVRGGRGKQQRVEPVEEAAVAAEEAARVLDRCISLDRRLEEVAQHGCECDRSAEHDRLPDRQVVVSI